jgi:fructose-bisphosphate aldolase class I
MDNSHLYEIAKKLVASEKGILAADESTGTIEKRLASIDLPSTEKHRRDYRELLFTAPEIEKFISGVIMFDETVRQSSSLGKPFPKLLTDRGIIPGIKVDKGVVELPNFPGEMVTEGIDGLRDRLAEYSKMGLKFAKWRAVFSMEGKLPTQTCIDTNSDLLARYTTYCQEAGLVPIVEPEVLMKGNHTIEEFAKDNKRVLKTVFIYLDKHKVDIKGMLLKPSWVHGGMDGVNKTDSMQVAKETLKVFKEVLPDELPGVVFLSGGDSPEDATSHLDKLNEIDNVPWQLSFSFGRALQEPVLETWLGKEENIRDAQQVFYERARLNSLAREGDY